MDTARPSPDDIVEPGNEPALPTTGYLVGARSVVVLRREHPKRRRRRGLITARAAQRRHTQRIRRWRRDRCGVPQSAFTRDLQRSDQPARRELDADGPGVPTPGEGPFNSTSHNALFRRYFAGDGTSYAGLTYSHGFSREEIRSLADLARLHSNSIRGEFDVLVGTRLRIDASVTTSYQERAANHRYGRQRSPPASRCTSEMTASGRLAGGMLVLAIMRERVKPWPRQCRPPTVARTPTSRVGWHSATTPATRPV